MNEPPEFIFGPNGLENWREIYRWAEHNDPLWHRCAEAYHHLSKERFLETLAALQLRQNIETAKRVEEFAKRGLPTWRFDWSADQ